MPRSKPRTGVCPPGFDVSILAFGVIDPRWLDRYLSQDFTNAGAFGPGGSMVFPPLGEASWVTASSASPPSWWMVSRKRPFNRVPPLAREEPVLMLSGLSILRRILGKEGLPSRVESRRVLRGTAEGTGEARFAKNDLIPTDTTRGKARTRPAQRQDKAADEWATSPTGESSHSEDHPHAYCPQLRASPDRPRLKPHGRQPLINGAQAPTSYGPRQNAEGQSDWRGRTT